MTKRYFHFTLGPVQGFVAQARRTRDFWAGSFLLSWLAGIAMNSVKNQNGEIIFPLPDNQDEKSEPHQGNIPNRFKAEVKQDFDPEEVVNEVKSAWLKLAELVWKEDLAEFCTEDPIHRQIWNRQINNLLEISYVGWVERSSTHQIMIIITCMVGFVSLYPPYKTKFKRKKIIIN